MEELARDKRIEYRARQETKLKAEDLNWAEIVLLGRLGSWYELQLVTRLRAAGKYLVYILDDDLLNIPKEIASSRYYAQAQIRSNVRRMLEMSDAILSPSPNILRQYAINGRSGWLTEEPAIEPAVFEARDQAWPVRIGFAGSVDRTGDLEEILKEALCRIKEEFKDSVCFEFFGAIPEFAKGLNARVIPYCDSYEEYRKTLNESKWDIGLAPMPATPFHACKHYNKFIEYAAAGCLTIHSDEEPYRRLHDLNCTISVENTPECWYQALKKTIENYSEREKMRHRASRIVAERMNCRVIADALYGLMLSSVKQERKDRRVAGYLPILKACNCFARAFIKLQIIWAHRRKMLKA